jgi:hypothetical protein
MTTRTRTIPDFGIWSDAGSGNLARKGGMEKGAKACKHLLA